MPRPRKYIEVDRTLLLRIASALERITPFLDRLEAAELSEQRLKEKAIEGIQRGDLRALNELLRHQEKRHF